MCPGSDPSPDFCLDAFFSQEAKHRSGGNLSRVVQKFHGMSLPFWCLIIKISVDVPQMWHYIGQTMPEARQASLTTTLIIARCGSRKHDITHYMPLGTVTGCCCIPHIRQFEVDGAKLFRPNSGRITGSTRMLTGHTSQIDEPLRTWCVFLWPSRQSSTV